MFVGVSVSQMALAGWVSIFDEPYSHRTDDDDVNFNQYSGRCLFVGCRDSSGASTYRTGAFLDAEVVSRTTAKNAPSLQRGVYWYNTPSYSFGFADTSTIAQNSADTHNKDSDSRLSWHLSGGGGWRCGSVTGLNEFVARSV